MTALATTATRGLVVAGVVLPRPSPGLRDALAHVADPHPDVGVEPGRIPDEARDEAARLLPRVDAVLRPAAHEDWRRFLLPLGVLPKAPANREAMAAAMGPIVFALHDLPAALLTAANQREAFRRFTYWPTPKELAALFDPQHAQLRAQRRHLQAVADAPRLPRPADLTPEQLEQRRQHAAATIARLRAQAPPDPDRPAERPAPDFDAIDATFERSLHARSLRGDKAAAQRLAMRHQARSTPQQQVPGR